MGPGTQGGPTSNNKQTKQNKQTTQNKQPTNKQETTKTIKTEETEPQITRVEEFVDKHGRKPTEKESWDMNLQYKNYKRPQDKFSTFEEYEKYVHNFNKNNTIDLNKLKKDSKGEYDKIKGKKIVTKEEVNIIKNKGEGTNPTIIQNINN